MEHRPGPAILYIGLGGIFSFFFYQEWFREFQGTKLAIGLPSAMDWIERLLHISPDAGTGSLELLYCVAFSASLLIGFSPLFLMWVHGRKRKKEAKMPVSPGDFGIPALEVGYLHVEGAESGVPFVFDINLMNRLKLAARKRKTTPEQLLSKAIVRAFENPAVLSEIENRHVRGRRAE